MDGESINEFERSRSVWQLIGDAFALYRHFPILFLALAAVAVVPYEGIVLLVTGAGPFAQGRTGFVTINLVTVADSFVILPLISALHVRAVREIGDGSRPRFAPTFRGSLRTLPVVAIATGISSVAILVGYFALFVPGALLTARWAVVAQTAALDGGGWKDPLRRSADLTRDYRWHSFGLVIVASLIAFVPSLGLGAIFGHTNTTAASFLVGTALQILLRSFAALATALLYFDLKARPRGRALGSDAPEWDPNAPASAAPTGTGDPLTPDGYTDANRPRGWYIDPDQPGRMRYWAADDSPVWSQRTAKTPSRPSRNGRRSTSAAEEAERGRRGARLRLLGQGGGAAAHKHRFELIRSISSSLAYVLKGRRVLLRFRMSCRDGGDRLAEGTVGGTEIRLSSGPADSEAWVLG